jgi:hypothetical protein
VLRSRRAASSCRLWGPASAILRSRACQNSHSMPSLLGGSRVTSSIAVRLFLNVKLVETAAFRPISQISCSHRAHRSIATSMFTHKYPSVFLEIYVVKRHDGSAACQFAPAGGNVVRTVLRQLETLGWFEREDNVDCNRRERDRIPLFPRLGTRSDSRWPRNESPPG